MNKTMVIGAIVLLLVVVAAGAYFLAGNKSPTTTYSTTVSTYTTVPAYTTVQRSTTVFATTSIAANSTVYTVNLGSSAAVGEYLTNGAGFTLYMYGNDVPNSGGSACYSSCATDWPPFDAASLSVPSGLNSSYFGTITRTGGAEQLTYKGHPLYLFIGDQKAGDTAGQGVGGFEVATK